MIEFWDTWRSEVMKCDENERQKWRIELGWRPEESSDLDEVSDFGIVLGRNLLYKFASVGCNEIQWGYVITSLCLVR
jgi:hypothetical protein